jgi:hypothetical protein
LLFQNSNNTLIRSPQKLQQLQTALACVAQTPLDNIDIATISGGSFTKPQGTGAPNCTAAARLLLYKQRRLQATTVDTTVSFDVVNAPYVSQEAFQNDPTILSFASSVGASGQVQAAPVPAPATASTSTGAVVGGFLGALFVVGIAGLGFMYVRSQRSRRPVSRVISKPKTLTTVNPFTSNNRISYSPAVVKMSRSNSV